MVEAGTGAKLQHQCPWATWLATSTAAVRHEVKPRVACTTNIPLWQKQRGGVCSTILCPPRRRAGAPWSVLVEQCCSFKTANGLCPRSVFECQHVSDVCHRRITLDGLHLRIRQRFHVHWTSAYLLDARSQLHTMVCMRACVLVALCARLPRDGSCARRWVGPVHGVKTHVSCSQNARALHKSEYAVSLIHHMRPLNRQETHGFCKTHHPQFCLRAVFGRATLVSRVSSHVSRLVRSLASPIAILDISGLVWSGLSS